MSADKEQNFCSDQAGVGSPADDYEARHAAYKKELNELLSRVPPGANVGPLIANLRKEYQLDQVDGEIKDVGQQPQGNWSLAELAERQKEREQKEKVATAQKQEQAQKKKQLASLRSSLNRLQFKKPVDFTCPEEMRVVLQPFETASDRQIWACFSVLKLQFREALANEFNLPGINVDILNFSREENFYPGGGKQLLADALSALKLCLRILLAKPEPIKKPAEKPIEKPVELPAKKETKSISAPVRKIKKSETARKDTARGKEKNILSAQRKPQEQSRQDIPLAVPPESLQKPAKSFSRAECWFGFMWHNKFRRWLGVNNPLATDQELEKAFLKLDVLQQKTIAFRYRIARPVVELRDLIASGLKRSVEEFAKKAIEELRQIVLETRGKEGVSIKFKSDPASSPLPQSVLKAKLPKTKEKSLPKADAANELKEEQADELPQLPLQEIPVYKAAEIDFLSLAEALFSNQKEKPLKDLFAEFPISASQLSELLLSLNKKQQEVLYWRFVRKLEWDDIARLMRTNRELAYGFFFRAIETIGKALRKQGPSKEEKDEWGQAIKGLNLFDSEEVRKIAEKINPRVLLALLKIDCEAVIPEDFILSLVLQPAPEIALNEYQSRLFLLRCGGLTNAEAGNFLSKTLNQTASLIYFFLPKAKRFFKDNQRFCFAEFISQIRIVWDSRLISGLKKVLDRRQVLIPVSPIQMAQAMRVFDPKERQMIILALVEKLGSEAIKDQLGLKYKTSHIPKKISVLCNRLAENLQWIKEKGISFLAEEVKFVPEAETSWPNDLPKIFSFSDIPEPAEKLAGSICNKNFFRRLFRFFREGIIYFSNSRQIAFCLRRLTPYEKDILFLRYKEGLDTSKIAERITRTRETVQNSERNAFKKIITDFTALLDSNEPMLGADAETLVQEIVQSVLVDNKEEEEKSLETSEDLLTLAVECWTDEFLFTISRYLGESADLISHPCQLANALTKINQSEKFVFQMSFGKERLSSKELAPRCHLKNSNVVQVTKRQALQKIAENIRGQGRLDSEWDKEPFYSAINISGAPLEIAGDKELKRREWVKEVLAIDFSNAESVMSALENISLEQLNKDLGGNVTFNEKEQLMDFLLLPPKYFLSFSRAYEGRVFLLSHGLSIIPTMEIAKNLRIELTSVYRYQWVCRQKIREFFSNLVSGQNNRLRQKHAVVKEKKTSSTLVSDVARLTNFDFQYFLLGLIPEIQRRNMAEWFMEIAGEKIRGKISDRATDEKKDNAPKIAVNISKSGPSKAARLLRSSAFREDLGIAMEFEELRVILEKIQSRGTGRDKVNVLIKRYCSNGQARRAYNSIAREIGWTDPTIKNWINSVLAEIRQAKKEGKK